MATQKKIVETYRCNIRPSTFVELEIYYHLGGMNYFSGKSEPRGYYFSVTPYEKISNDEGRVVGRSYTAFSGIKSFIKPANRFSWGVLESLTLNDVPADVKENMLAFVARKITTATFAEGFTKLEA